MNVDTVLERETIVKVHYQCLKNPLQYHWAIFNQTQHKIFFSKFLIFFHIKHTHPYLIYQRIKGFKIVQMLPSGVRAVEGAVEESVGPAGERREPKRRYYQNSENALSIFFQTWCKSSLKKNSRLFLKSRSTYLSKEITKSKYWKF